MVEQTDTLSELISIHELFSAFIYVFCPIRSVVLVSHFMNDCKSLACDVAAIVSMSTLVGSRLPDTLNNHQSFIFFSTLSDSVDCFGIDL